METFYGCYLLESEKQKQRAYIGFTMDPRRRLRQHNGEITAGAGKTRSGRPWKMVLCVWGFTNKIAALQFEFAWQHPAVCRRVKTTVAHLGFCKVSKRGRQLMVQGATRNMQVLFQMLQVSPYCRMPLRLHVFDADTFHQRMPRLPAVQQLPKHITITHGCFDDLEHICAEMMKAMAQPVTDILCSACRNEFRSGDRIVTCPSCEYPFHLSCAAQAFMGPASGRLMPEQPAACLHCGTMTEWPVLIRSARRWSVRGASICPPVPPSQPGTAAFAGAEPSCGGERLLAETVRPSACCPVLVIDSDDNAGDAPTPTERSGARGSVADEPPPLAQLQPGSKIAPDDASDAEDTNDALRARLFKRRRGDASVFGI